MKVQTILITENNNDENLVMKTSAHCRIYGLPACPELHRTSLPRNEDTGKFLQLSGTVVRITEAKMLEYQRTYVCTKCKYNMVLKADYEKKYALLEPKRCLNPESCHGTNIINTTDLYSANCKDYQEMKIQEQVAKLNVGSVPNSIWVSLEDDLVETCKPGDDVTLCGIVKRRWNMITMGKKIDIELVLKANHVQVINPNTSTNIITRDTKPLFDAYWQNYVKCPLVGRDLLLKSLCPQLCGLYMVKLAVAVVLAGGVHVTQNKSTGVSIRSEPHLLLVGDPGTGKSQLLRFASKVIPRSVLTTGVGSTAAGLTVTAFMENGAWQLEGGALVLSDGGLCCIDEFNSMKEHDRTCIHEAMEQQTISVAKASIVCKLNTRCSILAATNPKGNLDPQQPLNMNVALASPLLSRFDLIFLLRDSIDDKKDSLLTDYILNGKYSYSNFTDVILWNLEMLQVYFATIRKMNPMLSSEAHKILTSYYQRQRQSEQRNKSRTTVRLLDSLVRLSQGHAKLMSHPKVEIMDALYAILLVEGGLEGEAAVLGLQIDVNSMFPNNAMEAYRNLSEHILTKLQLLNLQEHEKQEFSCEAINDQDISTSIGSRFFYDKQPHEGNNRSNLDELSNKKIPVCEKSDSMNSKACHLLRRKTNNPEILHRQANVNSQGKKVKLAISDNVKKRKKTVGTTSKKLCLSEKSSESGLRLLTNITSVKDDFVIDVNLNYNSDENITEQVTNDGTAVSCESPNVKKEDKKDVYFTKDKMGQIQNEDSDIQFLSNPIDCRLSQGSKLKLFRKMFEFEPRKQNLLSRSKNSNEGASRIGIRRRHYVKSSISSSSTHFQSQPNEIDNLDLDL